MKNWTGQQVFLGFLLLWAFINLIQAGCTDLEPDEAYYWMYSRYLDWGYFDHPPVIALLIAAGYALFDSELGVRLATVWLELGTFWGVWLLADRPRDPNKAGLLIILLAAMPLLHVYGFIATPDAPLLFFTVVYLLVFRRFLQGIRAGGQPSWLVVLGLGFAMAAMLYSKYHGILVIAFSGLAHFRTLVRTPRYYLAAVLGAALFVPHLYWQYVHEFPSFRYHLSGRDDPYELKHTVTYLINQLVIFSPFLFPFMLRSLLQKGQRDILAPTLQWMAWGFWAFFLAMTFKGHVEPQWTLLVTFSLVLLTWRDACPEGDAAFAKKARVRRWLFRMGVLSVVLFLPLRLLLIWNYAGLENNVFHRRAWIPALREEAGGLPVLFTNSYRDPSRYTFYSGNLAYSKTDIYYRPNQFDIWERETDLHDQDVLLVAHGNWSCSDCFSFSVSGKNWRLKRVKNLQVSQKVDLNYTGPTTGWAVGDTIALQIHLHNPYPFAIDRRRGNMPLSVRGLFFREGQVLLDTPLLGDLPAVWPAEASIRFLMKMVVPESIAPPFDFSLGIQTGDLPPARNSFQWTRIGDE